MFLNHVNANPAGTKQSPRYQETASLCSQRHKVKVLPENYLESFILGFYKTRLRFLDAITMPTTTIPPTGATEPQITGG